MKNNYLSWPLGAGGRRLLLLAAAGLTGLGGARAQALNYQLAGASNVAGTYTDLGTSGSPIAVDNNDDANSGAQAIGFPFSYRGLSFSTFTLNTNGYLRLGSVPTSSASLLDAMGSLDATFNDLLLPFSNVDLGPATDQVANPTSFRVATTGAAGSRVCTIQWKNLRELRTTQFATMQFQVKLYEGTNAIEFVYGTWTPTTNLSIDQYAVVGLKGGGVGLNDRTMVIKTGASAWATATFLRSVLLYGCAANRTALPDAGRTLRFVPSAPPAPCTPQTVTAFPYAENFDGTPVGTLPCGMSVVDANNDNITWQHASSLANPPYTITPISASGTNAMAYVYSPVQAANDWLFTQPLQLTAGRRYQLSFKLRTTTSWSGANEKLEVKYGPAASPAAQATLLWRNETLTGLPYIVYSTAGPASTPAVASITPTTTGTYYVGFHIYSAADQIILLLDDLQLTETVVTATQSPELSQALSVYPNPGHGQVQVAVQALPSAAPLTVEVSNSVGQVVHTAPLPKNAPTTLDLRHLAPGLYSLKVSGGGQYAVRRLAID
ncbi:MAG: T9SS type A sorting domain-containing protein [Hymenobacter sp.]|nr:MAG: T9SS type A sorting domain-containing protein [Hymenobacter sp.]